MKGRLRFYAGAPDHFETEWLIRNELGRIGTSFFSIPFRILWRMVDGREVASPVEMIDELRGDLLTGDEIAAVKAFAARTAAMPPPGKEKEAALEIADVFDDYFGVLWKIGQFVSATGSTASTPPVA